MAWTTTKNQQYAVGNSFVQLWELTADSATLNLDTGFGVVDHVQVSPASAATNPANCQRNVPANGTIAITGATSGDDLVLTVWGH